MPEKEGVVIMSLPPYFKAIEKHLDNYFDKDDEIVVFDEIYSPDFHLDIYWVKANQKRNYHILMTNGVSSKPMNSPNKDFNSFIELVMLLPDTWQLENDQWKKENNYWPIESLKSMGRYPHENNTWLGFGHTVPEGEDKKIVSTDFVATLLLKSKSLPMKFQLIPFKKRFIDLYLLFPIYEEEYRFKKENGTNKLIDKFKENQISDIINIQRKNVCGI